MMDSLNTPAVVTWTSGAWVVPRVLNDFKSCKMIPKCVRDTKWYMHHFPSCVLKETFFVITVHGLRNPWCTSGGRWLGDPSGINMVKRWTRMSLHFYHVTFLDGSGWYMPLWGLTKPWLGVDSSALVIWLMERFRTWIYCTWMQCLLGGLSGLPGEEIGDS